jgi:hypothetical protein
VSGGDQPGLFLVYLWQRPEPPSCHHYLFHHVCVCRKSSRSLRKRERIRHSTGTDDFWTR